MGSYKAAKANYIWLLPRFSPVGFYNGNHEPVEELVSKISSFDFVSRTDESKFLEVPSKKWSGGSFGWLMP